MPDMTPAERQQYLDFRNQLFTTLKEQWSYYEKLVVSITSGSLGLSVLFLKDIAPDPTHRPILYAAWAALVASLICTLVSWLTSAQAANERIAHVDLLLNANAEAHPRVSELQKSAERWNRVTVILTLAAGGTMILGMALLAAFAGINLGREPMAVVSK